MNSDIIRVFNPTSSSFDKLFLSIIDSQIDLFIGSFYYNDMVSVDISPKLGGDVE